MTVTTKGRYALRIMIDIAQQDPDAVVPLKSISQRQDISMKYLEAIAAMLHKAGYITSTRGKNGGYRLARKPEEYIIRDLLKSIEGSLAPVSCLESGCPNSAGCMTFPLWAGMDRRIEEYLSQVTLKDIMDGTIPE
jgi:Rrf2 family protein